MASSFITKDNVHGFWINDGLMEVACWGMVSVIDTIDDNDDNWMKGEFRELLFNNSQGYFLSYMHLNLDEYLTSNERIASFIELIDKTSEFFNSKGDEIPVNELNYFQFNTETKHEWGSPLDSQTPINVLKYLKDVVNDKCRIKASDVIDYTF